MHDFVFVDDEMGLYVYAPSPLEIRCGRGHAADRYTFGLYCEAVSHESLHSVLELIGEHEAFWRLDELFRRYSMKELRAGRWGAVVDHTGLPRQLLTRLAGKRVIAIKPDTVL